jgi:hypothetical protein
MRCFSVFSRPQWCGGSSAIFVAISGRIPFESVSRISMLMNSHESAFSLCLSLHSTRISSSIEVFCLIVTLNVLFRGTPDCRIPADGRNTGSKKITNATGAARSFKLEFW